MLTMLAEKPFRTLQGEGLYIGHPSVFVRFSGCNLRCEWMNKDGSKTQCDTPYASYNPERISISTEMLVEQIRALLKPNDHIVFTGGEPTIYAEHINEIAKHFKHNMKTIETNGTNVEYLDVNMLSISPKLSFAGNDMDEELYAKQILNLIQRNPHTVAQVKFVVSNPEELEQVKRFAGMIDSAADHFMLMPQGITVQQIDEKLVWLAEAAKELGWILTDRQHIRIWKGARAT